ncbi:MAG TPA: serine hydrolase domain-containing protein [Candidatus Caenarcaniphilales bacterium]|nr:serine hydrolase domain-containing protein [Candidatus Caenarcaniphilales bacterium]
MASSTATTRLDPQLLDGVFEELADGVRSAALPSAALAIGDSVGPIRVETYGGPTELGISNESVFFLASVTKPIVATAVMQLVERGLLDLHAPLARYLPAFAMPDKENVTAWHLLTHTSGVPDVPTERIRRERPSAARMTEIATTSPLQFEPGTRWEYCSASFYLLGQLLQRLSGLPYPRYLEERLLAPLGMTHTTFDPRPLRRHLVPVHGVGADNRLKRFFLLRYLVSIAPPGGGLWGTLDDLLRFGAALLRPTRAGGAPMPLAPETIALMAEDHTRGIPGFVDGEELPVHFGLGWGKPTLMQPLPGSARVISHGGATGTRIWVDPEADLVFVYFTNQWAPQRGPEIAALRGTYEAIAAR